MTDQPSLLDWQPPQPPRFFGATYDPARDAARLSRQLKLVHDVLIDGRKRSLRELADAAGCPEASASARYRDLVRLGFPMAKENLGRGAWLYWMIINRGQHHDDPSAQYRGLQGR